MKGFLIMIAFVAGILIAIGAFYTFESSSKNSRESFKISRFSSCGDSGKNHDTEISTTTYPFELNGTLSIETRNGSITLTTHDKKEIIVKTIKTGDKKDFSKLYSNAAFTKETGLLKEVYNDQNDENFNCDASLSYEVTVPKNTTIDASSKNGSIALTGITHLDEVETKNGSIIIKSEKLVAVSREIEVETKNGNISFEVKTIEKNKIKFATKNGSIALRVTNPVILTKTRRNTTLTAQQATLEITTKNGCVTVESF